MTPRFDIGAIRRKAGDDVFARGEAYFTEGRVSIVDICPDRVRARVSGNETYRSVLTGRGDTIGGECSCPAFNDHGFCKHLVATALAAAEVEPQDDGDPVARIRTWLSTRDPAALVDLLVEQAERDDGLFRRLDMMASAASGDDETVSVRLREAITAATATGRFIDYREAGDWARGVEDALDLVATLVPAGRVVVARQLAEHALARIEAALGRIDDSGGWCSGLLEQARDIHLAACKAAPPESIGLAEDLFAREIGSEWGTFDEAAETYADVLGEAGLAVYRELAAAAWEKIPPVEARRTTRGDFSPKRNRLMRILDHFAARAGDVETRIALRSRDLSSPWSYLDLARFCLDEGREAEALRHAEEGLWLFEDDPPDERLIAFVAERHLAAGATDAALAVLQRAFERRPNASLYRRLRAVGGEAARDRALAVLRTKLDQAPPRTRWSAPADLLVEVLTAEGLFAEAWDAVRAHGVTGRLAFALAERSETSHPGEALAVYTTRVDELVSAGGNGNYEEACRLIAGMARLRSAEDQAGHVGRLRVKFRAKRNFIKILGG